jgi:drug/metabolite transporter (DMT)-like permease
MIYLTLSESTALASLGPLGSLVLARCLSLSTVQWIDFLSAIGAFIGVTLIVQPRSAIRLTEASLEMRAMVQDHLYGLICGGLGACGGMVRIVHRRQLCSCWLDS